MNNIYIKNNNQKRRIKDLDRSINSPIKFTHPKYYLLSDICLRLSDPSILPNIRNTVPTGFFVARRGHREAMEFYFSAAYYVSIMYRLLFDVLRSFRPEVSRRRPATHEERPSVLFDVLATVLVFQLRVREGISPQENV